MVQASAPTAPTPWRLHNTGGYIAILDARGERVLYKTTNTLSIEQYQRLRANFEFVVTACNAAGSSEADTRIAPGSRTQVAHYGR